MVPHTNCFVEPYQQEDYLMQLKRSCRLFHYCATPLIFSSSWRQSVVQKTTCKSDKSRQDNNPASTFNILNATAGLIAAGTPTTPDRTHKTVSHLHYYTIHLPYQPVSLDYFKSLYGDCMSRFLTIFFMSTVSQSVACT